MYVCVCVCVCVCVNIYINQLANILEHAPIQGLSLHDTEIKCLLYADDLVLLSPTEGGGGGGASGQPESAGGFLSVLLP